MELPPRAVNQRSVGNAGPSHPSLPLLDFAQNSILPLARRSMLALGGLQGSRLGHCSVNRQVPTSGEDEDERRQLSEYKTGFIC